MDQYTKFTMPFVAENILLVNVLKEESNIYGILLYIFFYKFLF